MNLQMTSYEQEQYALVFYLEHGSPGPIFKQIAEERIQALEFLKRRTKPTKYYPTESAYPRLEVDKTPTVRDIKSLGSKIKNYPS